MILYIIHFLSHQSAVRILEALYPCGPHIVEVSLVEGRLAGSTYHHSYIFMLGGKAFLMNSENIVGF
jgi:hypothetical protein